VSAISVRSKILLWLAVDKAYFIINITRYNFILFMNSNELPLKVRFGLYDSVYI